MPQRLGRLEVTAARYPIRVAEGAGACSKEIDVPLLEVAVVLEPEAEPFRQALAYETFVDGQKWEPRNSAGHHVSPAESWVGQGRDLVFASCPGRPDGESWDGLRAGEHTVLMRATIPGTGLRMETPPVTFAFQCASPDSDAASAAPERPTIPPAAEAPPAGCGCAMSPVPVTPALGGLVALLALGLRRLIRKL